MLAEKGLLDLSAAFDQRCPLCEDEDPTLTAARIADLASWRPLASALTETQESLTKVKARLAEQLEELRISLALAIPRLPNIVEINRQLKGASQRSTLLVSDAASTATLLTAARELVLDKISRLEETVATVDSPTTQLYEETSAIANVLASLSITLGQHRDVVAALEEAVGSAAREDFMYRLRDKWLELAGL